MNDENDNALPDTSGRPGIDRKMTKEEINNLPVWRFDGPVHLIRQESEIGQAIDALSHEPIIGFDIEIRPAFKKGQSYPPSLLQLADSKAVYLFQLKPLGLPLALRQLLSNPDIIKAGVAPAHDITKLKELHEFEAGGFVDLSDLAKELDLKNHGLRGLVAVIMGYRISKQAQTSNWSSDKLTQKQIMYAATDAWASREVYLLLKEQMNIAAKQSKTRA